MIVLLRMKATVFPWMFLSLLVEGSPTRRMVPGVDPDDAARAETGTLGRLVYGITSTVCLCALSFAMGLRVTQFERKKKLQSAWILSHLQTVVAMMLVVSGAILVYGFNLTSYKECRASITVCLFLYFSSKILLYMFYLERIHIARLPVVVERRRDPIWYAGMVINVGFFGGMALWCIATPHAAISLQDGQCRIGSGMIPSYITFSFDVIINVFCTGIFIWLILPMMRNPARGIQASDPPVRNPYSTTGVLSSSVDRDDKLTLSVKRMLQRNIIGSALTFAASAINLVVYFVDATSQIAYVCYTLCIIDVVLGVLVVQWLTFGSNKTNEIPCQEAAANNFTSSAAALSSITVPETINTQHKPSSI